MNKLLSHKNIPSVLLTALLLCLIICIALYIYLGGYNGGDLTGHWRICRYTLEGYNPYLLVGSEPAIDAVGSVPKGFSTVPWSCVFGSVFYGGWMPLEWARVYIYVLHLVALAALLAVLYQRFRPMLDKKLLAVLLLLPCTHFSFMYSVYYGNAGGIICCLLMITFLVSDKYPIVAGILLGLAMMKPQIAAIVCLVYLLKGQWKVLFAAAAVVLLGWGTAAIATSTSPLILLWQTLEKGTAETTQYLGLLNNLKYFGVDAKVILVFNVAIGAGYTIAQYYYVQKKHGPGTSSLFMYVPACIASTFWIYKNGTDYAIVAFCAMFFCLLCMKKELSIKESIGAILSIGYLQMSRCAVYLGILLFEDNMFVRDLFKSADGLIIALIGIYLCRLWVKHRGETVFLKIDGE